MNFKFNLKTCAYYPLAIIDSVFPSRARKALFTLLGAIAAISAVFIFGQEILPAQIQDALMFGSDAFQRRVGGAFRLALGIMLVLFMWESFRRDRVFGHYPKYTTQNPPANLARLLDYESFFVFYHARRHGLFIALAKSGYFSEMLLRMGITVKEYREWFAKNQNSKEVVLPNALELVKAALEDARRENRSRVTIKNLIAVLEKNELWHAFLLAYGISQKEAVSAIEWEYKNRSREYEESFWWRRENLLRVTPFARDWAYGKTYTLDKFSRDIMVESARWSARHHPIGHEKTLQKIEKGLLRSAEANVVIAGDEGSGKSSVLLAFAEIIRGGRSAFGRGTRILMIDSSYITASAKTKSEIETLLIKLMNEAALAGNVIVVFDHIASFAESLSSFGVNLLEILRPYMSSAAVKIIAVSNTEEFRRKLEQDQEFGKYFEKIDIEEPIHENLMQILEDFSPELERKYGVKITIGALLQTADASERYITEGALPGRAVNLLKSVVVSSASGGIPLITKNEVLATVEEKTKIPVGAITGEEREKIMNIEELLARRVIGQDAAVRAVADAIKRARAGVRSSKRPIGSFLFLGPTGVGKTETAKALAEAYFGDEERMIRLDMSEYQTTSDMARFIGSAETDEPGMFASIMRQKPYSLVLLDELEKASPEILNLFLQILDEGFFTDAFGKKINMRNAIIVATSNAASDIIWQIAKSGESASASKEKIIEAARERGIFSPELMNRFDGIVVFNPLSKDDLQKISRLMLEGLNKRLKEKEVELVITDELALKLADAGYSPEFGARQMRRVIQDRVEKIIAEKIISGSAPAGSKITIKPEEI